MEPVQRRVTTRLGDAMIAPAVRQSNDGDGLIQLASALEGFGASARRLSTIASAKKRQEDIEEARKLADRYNIDSRETFNKLTDEVPELAAANPFLREKILEFAGQNAGTRAAQRLNAELQIDPEFRKLTNADEMQAYYDKRSAALLDEMGDLGLDAAPILVEAGQRLIDERIGQVSGEILQLAAIEGGEAAFRNLDLAVAGTGESLSTLADYSQFKSVINAPLAELSPLTRNQVGFQMALNAAAATEDPEVYLKVLEQIPFSGGGTLAQTSVAQETLRRLRDEQQKRLDLDEDRLWRREQRERARVVDQFNNQLELHLADPQNVPPPDPMAWGEMFAGELMKQFRALERELMSTERATIELEDARLGLERRQQQSRVTEAISWIRDSDNIDDIRKIASLRNLTDQETTEVIIEVMTARKRAQELNYSPEDRARWTIEGYNASVMGEYDEIRFSEDLRRGVDPGVALEHWQRSRNSSTQQNASLATNVIEAWSARVAELAVDKLAEGVTAEDEMVLQSQLRSGVAAVRAAVNNRLPELLTSETFRAGSVEQREKMVQDLISSEARKVESDFDLAGEPDEARQPGEVPQTRLLNASPDSDTPGTAVDVARNILMQDPTFGGASKAAEVGPEIEKRAVAAAPGLQYVAEDLPHLNMFGSGSNGRGHLAPELETALRMLGPKVTVRTANWSRYYYGQDKAPRYEISFPDSTPAPVRTEMISYAHQLMNTSRVERNLGATMARFWENRRTTPEMRQTVDEFATAALLDLAVAHGRTAAVMKKLKELPADTPPSTVDAYTNVYMQMRAMYGFSLAEFSDNIDKRPETTRLKLFPSEAFAYANGAFYAEQLGIERPQNADERADPKHRFNVFMKTQFDLLAKDGEYDPMKVFGL